MNRYALITGGSNGIGKELAELFSKDGFDLILAARNKEHLDTTAKELEAKYKNTVVTIPIDLAAPDAAQSLFAAVKKKNVEVDVLVNNAGFGSGGKFWETDIKKETEEIHLNTLTLTMLTKLFLPQMIARKSGKVLNVASIAAFLPGPLMAVYYATKAYVLSFSIAIREELKGTGVSVTVLCPRQTQTGFAERAGLANSKLFTRNLLTAAEVAQVGYEGLKKNKAIVFSDNSSYLLTIALRLVPHTVAAHFAKEANS